MTKIYRNFLYVLFLFLCISCESDSTDIQSKDELSKLENTDAPQKRAMTAVDFLELQLISDAAVSSNGEYLSYQLSATDWEKNEVSKTSNFVHLSTGKKVELVNEKSKSGVFKDINWSPDSKGFLVYFREEIKNESNKKGEEKKRRTKQFYYFNILNKKLEQLTDFSERVSGLRSIKWDATGKGLYYIKNAERSEVVDWEHENKWRIKEYESEQKKEIWYFALEKKTHKAVVSGEFTVRAYDLGCDGNCILFSRGVSGLNNDKHANELWLYDIPSSQVQQLTSNAYYEKNASLSKDGQYIAYIATVNAVGEDYYEDNIFVQRVADSAATLLLVNIPMEMDDFSWGEDSNQLFIKANHGLRSDIFKYEIDSKKLTNLSTSIGAVANDHDVTNWQYNSEKNNILLTIADETTPGELYLLDIDSLSAKKLSGIQPSVSDKYILPKQASFQWQAKDGTKLEGLLILPIGHIESEKFPLVTITHGGPLSQSKFGAWNVSRYVSVMTGNGYGVFLPNHRGGTGYGDTFMRSMLGNYWRHSYTDILDGIDALIEQGYVDSDRLIKHGWSAGGHMTNKMITSTERFKAASSGAGVSDWVSMYGESDVRHYRAYWFGGAPWEKDAQLDNYHDQSILKDAWKIKTPTIFWSGEEDERVPPTQNILLYRGAKDSGADVQLYIAPEEPHNFRKPKHNLFKINTELAWYAKHVNMLYTPTYPGYYKEERKGK